jgi:hypothetical protein
VLDRDLTGITRDPQAENTILGQANEIDVGQDVSRRSTLSIEQDIAAIDRDLP